MAERLKACNQNHNHSSIHVLKGELGIVFRHYYESIERVLGTISVMVLLCHSSADG